MSSHPRISTWRCFPGAPSPVLTTNAGESLTRSAGLLIFCTSAKCTVACLTGVDFPIRVGSCSQFEIRVNHNYCSFPFISCSNYDLIVILASIMMLDIEDTGKSYLRGRRGRGLISDDIRFPT